MRVTVIRPGLASGKVLTKVFMPKSEPVEPSPIAEVFTFESILAKLPAKDRVKAEKSIAANAALDAPRVALWKRLAEKLMNLSGHSVKISGPAAMQFFVADGNYRKQVFALDDQPGIGAQVYCADLLDEAIADKIVKPPEKKGTNTYIVPGTTELLAIDRLVGTGPAEHPVFFKDMLSWNRKAIRISLPADASEILVKVTETLCARSTKAVKPKA
jgi:hypothetical protein